MPINARFDEVWEIVAGVLAGVAMLGHGFGCRARLPRQESRAGPHLLVKKRLTAYFLETGHRPQENNLHGKGKQKRFRLFCL